VIPNRLKSIHKLMKKLGTTEPMGRVQHGDARRPD